MKLIQVLYTMLCNLMFLALAASISAVQDKKKDTYRKALICACLILEIQHARQFFNPTSGALCDTYHLPDLQLTEFLDSITPSPYRKNCLLPIMDGPNVIQVWRIRATPLPDLTGPLSLETEEELNGAVEPQEIVIRQVTDPRFPNLTARPNLEPREELNEAMDPQEIVDRQVPDPSMAVQRHRLPEHPMRLERRPLMYSIRRRRDSAYPESVGVAARRQRYIENLETRIQHETHIQELRANLALTVVRGLLERLTREFGEHVHQANRPQQYTERIERIRRLSHDLLYALTLTTERGTLDSLIHELNGARADRDRQDLVALANVSPNVSSNASLGPARHVTQMVFRGIQHINASYPTIVTPQIHREATRAVIEGPATEDVTLSNLSAEHTRGRDDDAFTEEPTTNDSPDPATQPGLGFEATFGAALLGSLITHHATQEEIHPAIQARLGSETPDRPALLGSAPHQDTTQEETDPVTQPELGSEDTAHPEATGTLEES